MVNQNFLSEMHYKSDELIGRRIEEIVPEHVRKPSIPVAFQGGDEPWRALRGRRGAPVAHRPGSMVAFDPAASALGQWPTGHFRPFSSDLTRTIETLP